MIINFVISSSNLLNANKILHYKTKAGKVKRLRQLSYDVVNGIENKASQLSLSINDKIEKEFFDEFIVHVKIFSPTKRKFDPPNLYPTIKALIDGLTDANLWEDDNYDYMKYMVFSFGGVVKEHFNLKENGYVIQLEVNSLIDPPRLRNLSDF